MMVGSSPTSLRSSATSAASCPSSTTAGITNTPWEQLLQNKKRTQIGELIAPFMKKLILCQKPSMGFQCTCQTNMQTGSMEEVAIQQSTSWCSTLSVTLEHWKQREKATNPMTSSPTDNLNLTRCWKFCGPFATSTTNGSFQ